MNCKRISGMLYDYTRNELSAVKMTAVESHLSACPSCAVALQKIKKLRSYFTTGLQEPSPAVLSGIKKTLPNSNKTIFSIFLKPALALAAGVLLMTGIFTYSSIENKTALSRALMEDYSLTETYLSDTSDFDEVSYIYGNDYDNEIF